MTRSLALLFASLLTAGCGEDPPPSTDGVGAPVERPERPARDVPEPLYDAQGVPLESDEVVAGLTLPRGLTKLEEVSEERRHLYASEEVEANRLLRYFGPRLTTMQIDREGARVAYRDAVPRGVRGGVVRLDVMIRPSTRYAAIVEIVERLPPPPEDAEPTVSEEEIRRHLEGLTKNRE